jgi:hypothetical protein
MQKRFWNEEIKMKEGGNSKRKYKGQYGCQNIKH